MTRKDGVVTFGLAAAALAVLASGLGAVLQAQDFQMYNGAQVQPFTCRITAQTITKECRALTAGAKTYVTDAVVSNNVATAQTLKLVTGTGTDCATGAADLTHAIQFGAAVGNQVMGPFRVPLQPAAVGLAICVTPSAATSYSATISGFVAP
jgi:hypothetical protein